MWSNEALPFGVVSLMPIVLFLIVMIAEFFWKSVL